MAMFDVMVRVSVSHNSTQRVEEFETKVDSSIFYKSQSSVGREELSSWAKNFFPVSDNVKVIGMWKK